MITRSGFMKSLTASPLENSGWRHREFVAGVLAHDGLDLVPVPTGT